MECCPGRSQSYTLPRNQPQSQYGSQDLEGSGEVESSEKTPLTGQRLVNRNQMSFKDRCYTLGKGLVKTGVGVAGLAGSYVAAGAAFENFLSPDSSADNSTNTSFDGSLDTADNSSSIFTKNRLETYSGVAGSGIVVGTFFGGLAASGVMDVGRAIWGRG